MSQYEIFTRILIIGFLVWVTMRPGVATWRDHTVGGCGLGTSDAMVDTFQERQKELCFLSSFIEEHEKWLDGLLCQLGWTRDGLSGKVE